MRKIFLHLSTCADLVYGQYFSVIFPLFFVFIFFVSCTTVVLIAWQKKSTHCANSRSCDKSLSLQIDHDKKGVFHNRPVVVPTMPVFLEAANPSVMGIQTNQSESKRIYVNLKTQMLTAYDGDVLFMKTPISSGKWFKTPTGEFTIWVKLRSTRMSGGEGDDYYDLPNVPYVMFFSNYEVPASRGFSLHGTYWHNNFGHPMSHGCVNMKTTDIAKLYEWATPVTNGLTTHASLNNPGTKVTIIDGE